MTIRPATTEPGRGRRAAAAISIATILLLVIGYAATASIRVRQVLIARSQALIGLPASQPTPLLSTLPDAALRTAIAAMPLDQRIVNVAMARDVRAHGMAAVPLWVGTLSRLGWRDTPALQNMIYLAALAGDLSRILDIGDALLRRQQFVEQMIPAVSTVELDPSLRAKLADRLAAGPNWRGYYLASTGHLAGRAPLVARFQLVRDMNRRGARFGRGELLSTIRALDAGGLPQYGFALWQAIRPGATRPLDDTRFIVAGEGWQGDEELVPYQWQMKAGEGFSADVSRDGPRTAMLIDWNGRGVPLFAQQRTSATPGRYALEVAAPAESRSDLAALAFRLVCDRTTIAFRQTGAVGRYVSAASVPCAFPMFEIAGDVQPATTGHQVTIDRILLRRLGSTSASR